VKPAWAGHRLESGRYVTDVWGSSPPPSAILEREPGRVRGLSGKQTVSLAACDSGSPRSASLGRSS